ncbi:MAG: primosomal protein N' [Pseudomonadota bacterium]|nr:primosomal protein N' [Pseudomonadota bacterium]
MIGRSPIIRVAVASPLRTYLDYLPPTGYANTAIQPGCRVRVPLGRRETVGIIVSLEERPHVEHAKLRPIIALIDEQPLLPSDITQLAVWAASYYHHPPGEVFAAILPGPLRQGAPAERRLPFHWVLTPNGAAALTEQLGGRAIRQRDVLLALRDHPQGLTPAQLRATLGEVSDPIRRLERRGWIQRRHGQDVSQSEDPVSGATPPDLTADQLTAVSEIHSSVGYCTFLLDGVTGSGKTEIYLQAILDTLAQGKQALVLVPEIGLTPQLMARFRARIDQPLTLYHSGLTEKQRQTAWLDAQSGDARLIVGTRSAVFLPLPNAGLMVVDEEHDPSFKQQDGFRYSARDIAVWRAKSLGIPVILGSATPSLETLQNAITGRYSHLKLSKRATGIAPPKVHLVDMRHVRAQAQLSPTLLTRMREHLSDGGQVLLFQNRRGFAPILRCHACGWIAECERCASPYTVHPDRDQATMVGELRCHHCGKRAPVPTDCPACHDAAPEPIGSGTVRIEDALQQHFPNARIARVDRDATQRKGTLEKLLTEIRAGHYQILIGTQMLAKGHHFPNVNLAAVLDADQGLYSTDFRAGERLGQLIVQVAGRAGRHARQGEVLVQTHHPDHPMLGLLIEQGYGAFARALLGERERAGWPPFTRIALLRAEASQAELPMAFLSWARQEAIRLDSQCLLLGPVPAPMHRRAGRYRAQLLVQADSPGTLHALLTPWIHRIAESKPARQVRWSVDVDPCDTL